MTPEQFFEQMKKMFESQNDENDENNENVSNTNKTQNKMVVRPKKQYIKVNEILTLFGITKSTYNNILVRR
jgi:hypothetical protein